MRYFCVTLVLDGWLDWKLHPLQLSIYRVLWFVIVDS